MGALADFSLSKVLADLASFKENRGDFAVFCLPASVLSFFLWGVGF